VWFPLWPTASKQGENEMDFRTEIKRLELSLEKACRRAEWWKAEHLAGNKRIAELEEQIKQQAVVIEQMREALQLCRSHMYCHASNTGDNAFDKLCSALALHSNPEVLNKVKRDAIIESAEAWKEYAQRIEKGEA